MAGEAFCQFTSVAAPVPVVSSNGVSIFLVRRRLLLLCGRRASDPGREGRVGAGEEGRPAVLRVFYLTVIRDTRRRRGGSRQRRDHRRRTGVRRLRVLGSDEVTRNVSVTLAKVMGHRLADVGRPGVALLEDRS